MHKTLKSYLNDKYFLLCVKNATLDLKKFNKKHEKEFEMDLQNLETLKKYIQDISELASEENILLKNKNSHELNNNNNSNSDKDKEKNKEKDKEKNKENDTSKKDITKLNKIDSFTNNFGPYLSNEEIQFALDSGFDFNDIMDAIERNNGNFELAVNQLINHQDRDSQ